MHCGSLKELHAVLKFQDPPRLKKIIIKDTLLPVFKQLKRKMVQLGSSRIQLQNSGHK